MRFRVIFAIATVSAAIRPTPVGAIPAENTTPTQIMTQAAPSLLYGVYGRENSLPLCDWSTGERSLLQFIVGDQSTGDRGLWTCRAADSRSEDSCSWSNGAPTNASYAIVPRDQHNHFMDDLAWPDGSGAYGLWSMSCLSRRARGPLARKVASTNIEGQVAPWAEVCSGLLDPTPYYDVILADVDGGTVDHIRPGLVRGTVTIAMPPRYMTRVADDLEIAIQALTEGQWQDVAVTVATAETWLQTLEVQATVTELTDVRLQVRGLTRCQDQLGVGYDLRDARIFVETCVPDQANPGVCL